MSGVLCRLNAWCWHGRDIGTARNENANSIAGAVQDAEAETATECGAGIRDARSAVHGAGDDVKEGTADLQRKPCAMR